MEMHESVANHLSAAVSEDGKQFLMNRKCFPLDDNTARFYDRIAYDTGGAGAG